MAYIVVALGGLIEREYADAVGEAKRLANETGRTFSVYDVKGVFTVDPAVAPPPKRHA